jgi:hypothetical protein
VHYRIVIAATNFGVPSRSMQTVLGLGLDLEPEIFDYVLSTLKVPKSMPANMFPLPWVKDAPALRIGSDVLCILGNTPKRTSKTGTYKDIPSTIRLADHVNSNHISGRQ